MSHLSAGGVVFVYNLVTENQNPLSQLPNFWNIAFHSIDHNRTGHAIERLLIALTMWVCVIPVQAWRLIEGNIYNVVQGLARHCHHGENVILRRVWRHMESVEVEIRHVPARAVDASFSRLRRHLILVCQSNIPSG